MCLSIMDLGPWITVCLVAFFVCNYMESRGDVCVLRGLGLGELGTRTFCWWVSFDYVSYRQFEIWP